MEYYKAMKNTLVLNTTWVNLTDIILSKRRQTEKILTLVLIF